ncbi:MAG: M56 family metallopeptidase [Planctomycetota bacterium]|jgi:beta-lactamase regulating signal transducer with metallopeptidase domain
MTDFLLQFVVGNVLVAAPLALVAHLVQRSQRVPTIAHVLWLLVLVKLVTPPLLTLPVVPIPTTTEPASTSTAAPLLSVAITNAESMPEVPNEHASVVENTTMAATAVPESDWIRGLTTGLLVVWFVGALFVLVRSLVPIVRFHRLMRSACRSASPRVHRIANETVSRLGMRACPAIETIPAQVAPLVWCFGGRVRVVLPEALAVEMYERELQMVLAHELAHVKRHDYLVRWIEWLACAAFWWNPIAWWARRNLRLNEEMCCDAMVLDALSPDPRGYAGALLNVVEFLASSAIRPPAMACAMNGGGTLERRLGMIISQRTRETPTWLTAGVVALSMGLLPLGVAYAQDFDAVGKRLRQAVAEGEPTGEHARAMMETLRRSATNEDAGEHGKGHDLEELKAGIEQRLRRLGEGLRRQFAAGEITREEMETKYKAAERDMWSHYRAAEMQGHRGERDHSKDHDLGELKASIEQRLKQLGAELPKAIAAGEISEEDAKAKYKAAKKQMWGRYRQAEMQNQRGEREPDGMQRRVAMALTEAGIERRRVRDILAAMDRIVHELKAEGDDFELSPRMESYLKDGTSR